MAAVAGPSSSRKRTLKDRQDGGAAPSTSRIPAAPLESFGSLELAQAKGDAGAESVDEDYDESGADNDSNDEEEDDFPEIDAASDGEDDEEDDEDAGDVSEEEQILRELAEEEELERDLADTSDSSFSDENDDADDDDREAALSHAIRRATRKPDERYGGEHDVEEDERVRLQLEKNALLGFDTRPYRERAIVGTSAITGEDRWTWDRIEPVWDDDEGAPEAESRVGKIPSYFYDGMPHVGYDMDGKKVMRPAQGDELDKFLATIDDPSSWTSVEDKLLHKNVQLTDEELELVQRLARAENPDAAFDPYEPTIEWFTGKGKEMAMPLSHAPEPKRRFIPSKWEHKKVMKIVRAIRQGRILPKGPKQAEKPAFYPIWSSTDEPLNLDAPMTMPAPKLRLPGHEESYNPPAEYLFSKSELKEWNDSDPSDRKLDFIPAKHDSLRRVPGYENFVQERFNRCLDLYLAPRAKKRKPKILEGVTKPEDLLPQLPDPKELRPFPTFCSVVYPHPGDVRVRSVSVDPTGCWVLTGAEDGYVRLWECRRGKLLLSWKVDDSGHPVHGVEWCPDKDKMIFAAVSEGKLVVGAPMDLLAPEDQTALLEYAHAGFSVSGEGLPAPVDGVKWSRSTESAVKRTKGILLEITVPGTPKQVAWHRRGDYLATVAPDAAGGGRAVLMHQITKHSTQAPFKRLKGVVQKVTFHPTRPHFLVATERYVRIYDLMAQSLVKTLQPGVRHVSSVEVHPLGDNVIVGSYDRRLVWHDLDLSERPYKTLRYHPRAIRSVAFSTRFPLFLSTSDDGTVQVFHSTVYSDLITNPLIVPLKVLRGHSIVEGLGVLEAKFHPTEPWVVSAGADGTARLWM